jgi:hypothetical protein
MTARMARLLTASTNVSLLETIESIVCTATSDPEFGADGVANYTQAKLLNELGFSILVKGGLDDLSKEERLKAIQLAREIAGNVLSVWKGSNVKSEGVGT